MGKKRDQDDLAEYFLRAAGVAAIWVDEDGFVGAHGAATVEEHPGRITYCCLRGKHFMLAYQVHEWKAHQAERPPQHVVARKLEHMAELTGVGLTKHHVAVDRAHAAVAAVEDAFEKMTASGEMREWNAAFKAARSVEPTLRYHTFIEAKKAAMLEELARRSNGS